MCGGRFPVQAAKREDPKDGGIWEPVKRQYPKVPRVDYGNGVRIVNKPAVANRPVDIWPGVCVCVSVCLNPNHVTINPKTLTGRTANTATITAHSARLNPKPQTPHTNGTRGKQRQSQCATTSSRAVSRFLRASARQIRSRFCLGLKGSL
jgi:hypothetical protein